MGKRNGDDVLAEVQRLAPQFQWTLEDEWHLGAWADLSAQTGAGELRLHCEWPCLGSETEKEQARCSLLLGNGVTLNVPFVKGTLPSTLHVLLGRLFGAVDALQR